MAAGFGGGMLGLGGRVRIFVYRRVCDMRKQMDGLSNVVRSEMGRDPRAGDLFVFRNRRRDMIKMLFHDRNGCCLLAKRMERGTFSFHFGDTDSADQVELTRQELASLLTDAKIIRQ